MGEAGRLGLLAALVDAAPGHVEAVRKHMIDQLSPEQISQLEQIGSTIVTGLETGECKAIRAEED